MNDMSHQLTNPPPPPLLPKIYIAKLIFLPFLIEPFQMVFYVLSYIWLNIQGFLTQKKLPQQYTKSSPSGREKLMNLIQSSSLFQKIIHSFTLEFVVIWY